MWRLLSLAGLLEPKWNVAKLALVNKEAVKPKEPKEGSGLLGEKKKEVGGDQVVQA